MLRHRLPDGRATDVLGELRRLGYMLPGIARVATLAGEVTVPLGDRADGQADPAAAGTARPARAEALADRPARRDGRRLAAPGAGGLRRLAAARGRGLHRPRQLGAAARPTPGAPAGGDRPSRGLVRRARPAGSVLRALAARRRAGRAGVRNRPARDRAREPGLPARLPHPRPDPLAGRRRNRPGARRPGSSSTCATSRTTPGSRSITTAARTCRPSPSGSSCRPRRRRSPRCVRRRARPSPSAGSPAHAAGPGSPPSRSLPDWRRRGLAPGRHGGAADLGPRAG